MIKRNGDNVFAIASTNNQCQSARGASVSLWPGGGGGAATRIPRATAARMTPPDAQHNTKEANIALSTYVEKWKNRYEDAERKHKTCLLKAEKGTYLRVFIYWKFLEKFFSYYLRCCVVKLQLRMLLGECMQSKKPVVWRLFSYLRSEAHDNLLHSTLNLEILQY